MNFDWAGERRMRHWRIEYSGFGFLGVNTASAIDTFLRATAIDRHRLHLGRRQLRLRRRLRHAAVQLVRADRLRPDGLESRQPVDRLDGLPERRHHVRRTASRSRQRWFPPVNAWMVRAGFGATGNVSVTQSGTTVTVATSATIPLMQTAFDTAFGAGKWKIGGVGGSHFWAVGSAPSPRPPRR
jgi:hypothetical protein